MIYSVLGKKRAPETLTSWRAATVSVLFMPAEGGAVQCRGFVSRTGHFQVLMH